MDLMVRGMKGIGKSRMVTLIIPAGNTNNSISFVDQPDLRYARILAIETFTSSDMQFSVPDNIPVISDAQLNQITLTLETNDSDDLQIKPQPGQQFSELLRKAATDIDNPNATGRFRTTSQNIKWQPLAALHRIQNASTSPFVREIFMLNNTFVTWDKSFITMPTAITPMGNLAVVFQVYYSFTNIFGGEIRRT